MLKGEYDMDAGKIFSENLNHYMALRNVTQEELAEYLGISRQAVSLWCRGKGNPRMSKIESICQYLNINREDLLLEKNKNSLPSGELERRFNNLSAYDQQTIIAMIERFEQNK